jgi:hypothetical protein
MPYAILDGIKTHYFTQGSGPCLLMMAPRGFNSRIQSWQAGKWQEMDVFNAMAKHFRLGRQRRRTDGDRHPHSGVARRRCFARDLGGPSGERTDTARGVLGRASPKQTAGNILERLLQFTADVEARKETAVAA